MSCDHESALDVTDAEVHLGCPLLDTPEVGVPACIKVDAYAWSDARCRSGEFGALPSAVLHNLVRHYDNMELHDGSHARPFGLGSVIALRKPGLALFMGLVVPNDRQLSWLSGREHCFRRRLVVLVNPCVAVVQVNLCEDEAG